MPLMEHIRELRNRLVKAALASSWAWSSGLIFLSPDLELHHSPVCPG